MVATIPVTIVTGFLGAGKTTLINQLLRDPDFAETAVLINEFGDVQIDHDLVADFSDELVMTTTGCICCTASSDISQSLLDLKTKLAKDGLPPFRRVIIETTGLMDPVPVIAAFLSSSAHGEANGSMREQFALARVVSLFDIVNGPVTLDNHEEALKHVALSDVVLLTKTDLAHDPATKRDIADDRKRLTSINAGALILDRQQEWPQIRDLFLKDDTYDLSGKSKDAVSWLNVEEALIQEKQDHAPGHHHNGHHHNGHDHDHTHSNRHGDDIRSHVIFVEEPISSVAFSFFLDTVKMVAGTDLLRLKGLIALSDNPEQPLVVHGVQHLIHPVERLDQWPSEDRRSRIVIIGRDLNIDALRTVLQQLG